MEVSRPETPRGRTWRFRGVFLWDDGRGPTEAQHSSMEGRKPCWVVIFLQHQEDLHMDKAGWTPRKMNPMNEIWHAIHEAWSNDPSKLYFDI